MIEENLHNIQKELPPDVKLVAVSKFHPLETIIEAAGAGQLRFGESRPQEFQKKVLALEAENPDLAGRLEWHFIGHLQTNKLKMVLPYASLVQSIDSLHLLQAVDGWGKTAQKTVNVLLELHIGAEKTKQGFVEEEALDILFNASSYANVRFCGLMGMASHSDDEEDIRADFSRISSFFAYCRDLFPELESFRELSIGMSGDWRIALEYGATMVRIGTAIFGPRQY